MQPLNAPDQAPAIEFAVDSEHSGVRLVGCSTFAISALAAFLVLNSIVVGGGLITIVLAVFLAVCMTYLADYLSKRFWPSNRAVQFVGDLIHLTKGGKVQSQIDAAQTVNILLWHFAVKKHPRVPKGWYVVANALEQEGDYLATYSIVSPAVFEALPLSRLSKAYQRKRGKRKNDKSDLREAGADRRLGRAEFIRGEFGAEMSPEDYHAYLEYLADTYPTWMPKEK